MPLSLKVKDVTTVPEAVRQYYVAQDDEFILDLDGYEDPAPLKSALDKERKNAREQKAKVKEIETKFVGIDPDEARDALNNIDALKSGKVKGDEEIEAIVTKRLNNYKAERDLEVTTLTTERDALKKSLHTTKIDTGITAAATAYGTLKKGALGLIKGDFEKSFTIDDQGAIVALDENGDIRYSKDGIKPLTIEEEMVTFLGEREYLLESSTGGGSHNSNVNLGGKTNLGDTLTMSGSQRLNTARKIADGKGG